MRALLLAGVLAFGLATPALAQEAACPNPVKAVQAEAQQHGMVFGQLPDADQAAVIADFRAKTGKTDEVTAVFLGMKGGAFMLFLADRDCITFTAGPMGAAAFAEKIGVAAPAPASEDAPNDDSAPVEPEQKRA